MLNALLFNGGAGGVPPIPFGFVPRLGGGGGGGAFLAAIPPPVVMPGRPMAFWRPTFSEADQLVVLLPEVIDVAGELDLS